MATTVITTAKPLPGWLVFLLNMVASQVEQTGEALFVNLLQKLHDKNVDEWKASVYGLWAAGKGLTPLVAGTPTKLDDGLVLELKQSALDTVAANPNDGVILT
jgi:hypothetical protein